MFRKVKSWDDRRICDRRQCTEGRTWTRRVQWLEDGEGRIKLKFEHYCLDGHCDTSYREVLVTDMAQTVYDRFKAGQSIDDSCSILTQKVPHSLQSRKASQSDTIQGA